MKIIPQNYRQPSPSATSPAGFTLIEVVVYLGLFSIIIGGGVASAYAVIESSARNETKAMMQEEGDFLIGKINWALSGASAVNSPPSDGTPGTKLNTNKYDGTTVQIKLDGTDLTIDEGGGVVTLNNTAVQVTDLTFIHVRTGSVVNPESVTARFTISPKNANLIDFNQTLMNTYYLRK